MDIKKRAREIASDIKISIIELQMEDWILLRNHLVSKIVAIYWAIFGAFKLTKINITYGGFYSIINL